MSSLTIQEMPESDRPREKLARLGAGALSEAELIAILLRVGMRGMNAVDLARGILLKYGSLAALARCSVTELANVKGIGVAKAVQLAAAFGLGQRLAFETISAQPMDKPALIYAFLGAEMRTLERESLRVILLDTKSHLIRVEEISLGSLNETTAHPREILRPAIVHAAFCFVLVHNHPSGDPAPSDSDRRMTRKIIEAATLLQIGFSDHVIIGAPLPGRLPYFSFAEAGWMQK